MLELAGCPGNRSVLWAVVLTLAVTVPVTSFICLYLRPRASAIASHARISGNFSETTPEVSERIDQREELSKPAAHLIGWHGPPGAGRGLTLAWEASLGGAFTLHRARYLDRSLLVPDSGFYFVYCQVGFRGQDCPWGPSRGPGGGGGGPGVSKAGVGRPLVLTSSVFGLHDSYPQPQPLVSGAETPCSSLWPGAEGSGAGGPGPGGPGGRGPKVTWYTSLSQGAVVQLEANHELYVNVSHPQLVDYSAGKTFFGMVKV